MQNELEVCSHCRLEFTYRLVDDIGLYVHWVDDWYLIDIVLIFEKRSFILFREVFR